ncbi:MAG: hypothetical protein KDA85_17110, partial [Planctomycetaceae bacterium]|nr:hypothetical protein [Planctomycetaceae bacterium]
KSRLLPASAKCPLCKDEECQEECDDCREAARKDASPPAAQATEQQVPDGRRGMGQGHGHADDDQHEKDHQDFFYLLERRDAIRREVRNLPNGIETVTESDDQDVAARIQVHVESMYDRVENGNPIRMRDPLFREIFANAEKITMDVEHTDHGVLVRETSEDPHVVKLLQEHAQVVNLFIRNGYQELPKNHAIPE